MLYALFFTFCVYIFRASTGGTGGTGGSGGTAVTVSDATSAVTEAGAETRMERANLAGTRGLADVDTEAAGISARAVSWWQRCSWKRQRAMQCNCVQCNCDKVKPHRVCVYWIEA